MDMGGGAKPSAAICSGNYSDPPSHDNFLNTPLGSTYHYHHLTHQKPCNLIGWK